MLFFSRSNSARHRCISSKDQSKWREKISFRFYSIFKISVLFCTFSNHFLMTNWNDDGLSSIEANFGRKLLSIKNERWVIEWDSNLILESYEKKKSITSNDSIVFESDLFHNEREFQKLREMKWWEEDIIGLKKR